MALPATDTAAATATATAAATVPAPELLADRGSRRGAGVLPWVGMPIFLTLLLVGTYLWVSNQEIDSVEARVLNSEVLLRSLREHLFLSFVSTAIVIAIAIPAGVILTRPFARRFVPVALAIANVGAAIPSFGLISIIVLINGLGVGPIIIGLVAYSALPILRNTMVGLQQVNPSLIKASRGMGMSPRTVLFSVELPLAVPVMIAGIRTALIINVGTAALATFFNGGGLGFVIFNGIQLSRDPVLYTGVVMVSALALLIDYLGAVAGRVFSPKGL